MDERMHLRNLEISSRVRRLRGLPADPETEREIRELRSRIATLDAPPEIVRAGIPFCYREFSDDIVKRGECVTNFAESTSPEELRRRLACTAGSTSTRDAEKCVRTLDGMAYKDGTTSLDVVLGTDAAEYARGVVASAEPILIQWEHPELVPVPAAVPAVTPAPVTIETRRRERVYPIPGRFEEEVRACLPQLPVDLRAKLEARLPELLEDIQDRLFTSTIAQKREICHQVRDAMKVEPRLAPLEACLCGLDRRLQVPTLLELVAAV